jgi:hypothetical protein
MNKFYKKGHDLVVVDADGLCYPFTYSHFIRVMEKGDDTASMEVFGSMVVDLEDFVEVPFKTMVKEHREYLEELCGVDFSQW